MDENNNLNNSNLSGDSATLNFNDINNINNINNDLYISNKTNKNPKNTIISNLKLLLGYEENKKNIFITIILIVAFFVSLFFFVSKNAQNVYIDNHFIGSLSGIDLAEDDLKSMIQNSLSSEIGLPVEIDSKIFLELARVHKTELLSEEAIIKNSSDAIAFKVEGTSIYVEDKIIATVKTMEEAEQALLAIKNNYVLEYAVMTKEPTFIEDVVIINELVSNDDIIDTSEAIEILSANQNEEKIHIIVEGDTLFGLALDNDLTLKEVLAANPQLNEETTLKLGLEINLVVPVPLISVRTYEEIVYTATIAREVKSIPNDDEYKTYSEILVEGSDGSKEITASLIKVNGVTESETVVGEVILVEPVAKEVAVGTLETLPKRALGSFVYPVSGARLSSGFGQRWGTLHKGIDLACGANTPIRASDGGTVTYSGWNSGGYGYMVKIDHGNGFETLYAHNSKNAVTVGQQVAQGEVIAYVGSTGDSTGNHLHFEVIKNGVYQNPLSYI